MNQLDQLGMRISHIDSAFDQWIKQQNTNYNTFAVLYTLATEQPHSKIHRRRMESAQANRFRHMQNTGRTRLADIHESEQDKRERLLSLTEQGKESAAPLVQNMQEFSKRILPPR